jgi:hypothetical protein
MGDSVNLTMEKKSVKREIAVYVSHFSCDFRCLGKNRQWA